MIESTPAKESTFPGSHVLPPPPRRADRLSQAARWPAFARRRYTAHMRALRSPVLLLPLGLLACPDPEPSPPAAAWQVVAKDLPEALLSVVGNAADDVWAVGSDKGAGPLVLHFDGAAWSRLETGHRGHLWWVHPFPNGVVYLAGAASTILRYDGANFTRMATPGIARHTVFGIWGAAPDDVWAVGSVSSRNGFVWHYDGTTWRDVELPSDTPVDAGKDHPGLFKVWGDGQGTVWMAGGGGLVLKTEGDRLVRVETNSTAQLFTIAGEGDDVVAVGGSGIGAVLQKSGAALAPATVDAGLLQGVAVRGGRAYAAGAGAEIYRREGGAWVPENAGLGLSIESLHAVWIDPQGAVWAVGGNVLGAAQDHGALVHYAAGALPTYSRTLTPKPEDTQCPTAAVDPEPNGSIARRWNEQILGAIRRDVPRPTVHARNLYHLSVAMWDAWAAYDPTGDGALYKEKATATDVDAARRESISYAAYRVLMHRYEKAIGGKVSADCFTKFMVALGYDPADTTSSGTGPRALGNLIGQRVIDAFADDGANEANNYADTTNYVASNPPLLVDASGVNLPMPSIWQELTLAEAETQNGIPQNAGVQGYIGAHWTKVRPFAMTRSGPDALYHDPGPAPVYGAEMKPWVVEVIEKHSRLDPTETSTIDLSPGGYGNNSLGANDGRGHALNPKTNQPYTAQVVSVGDFARVLAEFWADGPKSETPPGHWNTIANYVADHPQHARRLFGAGPELDPLEWDVKVYLALNGAVHDAAITAWEIKRRFLAARPISLVRYMAQAGQSSDPSLPSYSVDGLPLVPGVIELITAESSAQGQRHAHLARYLGQIAVRSWRGEPGDRQHEVGGVGWIRGVDWIPYQRRTFVTPAFPGFISGHSTFSRAAAEVLTAVNGDPYFPGGLGEFVAESNAYLVFEQGPARPIRLQWATYYDAADQAGQSRLWGGIHIAPDDFAGRRLGAQVGVDAVAQARKCFDGTLDP